MKKLISILLMLALLCGATALAEGGCDGALDAAFEKGEVAFAPADVKLPDIASCEIVMPPDALWQYLGLGSVSEAQLRAMLSQAELAVFSYAPDGETGVGLVGDGSGGLPVAITPERIVVICPTEERGVYSEYGMPMRVYQNLFMQYKPERPLGMGDEGVIWSPGGRYLCVLNSTVLFQQMRAEYGTPAIIDTQTGEMFALDSFGEKPMAGGYGFWITGCFAGDESAFYALAYTDRYDDRYSVVRYDLQTCEATPCGGFENNGLPTLSMLSDGSVFALIDIRKMDEPQVVARVSQDGSIEKLEMCIAGECWRYRARRAVCSADSGWALLRGVFDIASEQASLAVSGLQRLRASGDLSDGADAVWVLSADTRQFEAVEASQLPDDEAGWTDFKQQHMQILDVKLSPEGRYAAVLAAGNGEAALLIARLEDMVVLPAEGVDPGDFQSLAMRADKGMPYMEWSEAGLLTMSGGLWQPKA